MIAPRLLTALAIAVPSFASAQHAPSQSELNGFLLGQYAKAIAHQLGPASQEQRTDDHWVYRVHIIDRAHHAYMVFKYAPDRPDYAISAQLAGDSGTSMTPFLGFELGADTALVRSRAGGPTEIEPESDPPLILWRYADRNYSFEFTPSGRLYSIQIFGYDGFPAMPPEALAPLEPLRSALASRSVQHLLQLLAPDVEVSRGGKTARFEGSARHDLSDSTSALWRALFRGPGDLRSALADSTTYARGEVGIRVYEHPRPGAIYTSYRFARPSSLAEVVFEGFAGQWRLWEATFR